MTQPGIDPKFATDDLYAGGAAAGQPNKVEPSSGIRSDGFHPSTFLPPQRLNSLLNVLGSYVDGLADMAVYNYGPRYQVQTGLGIDVTNTSTPSPTRLVAARMNVGTDTIPRELLIWADLTAGTIAWTKEPELASSWQTATTSGLAVCRNPVVGSLVGDGPYIILWDNTTGEVKKSTLLGTWADAGDVAGTFGGFSLEYTEGLFMPGVGAGDGRWVLCRNDQVAYSDDLADSPWTVIVITGTTGVPPPTPRCGASGSDGAAFGTAGDQVYYSQDGATWDAVQGTPVLRSIDFSESHLEWIGVDDNGDIWSAPVGMGAWTMRTRPTTDDILTIRAHGRAYAVGSELGLFVATNLDGPWTRLPVYPVAAAGWSDLCRWAGCLVVADQITDTGSEVFTYRVSLTAPYEKATI